jgi:hypothetical protein
MSRAVEREGGNREVSPIEIRGARIARAEATPEEGARGGPRFPHATEPKAKESPA